MKSEEFFKKYKNGKYTTPSKSQYTNRKWEWVEIEKEFIIEFHKDRFEMLQEELGLNKNQLDHFITDMLDFKTVGNFIRSDMNEKSFANCKEFINSINKLFMPKVTE